MRLLLFVLSLWPVSAAFAAAGTVPTPADIAWYGMYAGILGVVVLMDLVFWAWRRDLAYACLAASSCLVGLAIWLFSGLAVPSLAPDTLARLMAIFSILACVSTTVTFKIVLRLRTAPRAYPWLIGVMAAALAYLLATAFIGAPTLLRGAEFLALLLLSVTFVLAVYLFARRPDLRAGAAVFLPLHLGGIAFFLHALGTLECACLEHALEAGSALHMVLLNILLANQARLSEHAQEISRRQALESARRSERQLEDRVRERTAELFQANALLQVEISERRKLEKELHAALATERNTLRAQRRFVSMVSHEFRTPLAIIDTTAQRLDMAMAELMPELLPRITKIRRAVSRLSTLIDNCLTEDRLSTHDTTLRLAPADPVVLLRRAARDALTEHPERVRVEMADGLRPVPCDAQLVGIALSNLLKNALNY